MIIPATERNLKNRVDFGLAIKNTFTFAYRALLKAVHNPESFMDITIMPIMFTLLFTYLFGGAIAGSIANYLPIIVPGILIQTLVTSCGTSGTQLREDTEKSITNRFKSMPVAQISPLTGALTSDLIRYAIAGIIVFAVGAILGYRPGILAIIACIAFMMLIAWCLSWLFAFIAMSVKSVSTASTLALLIMFPLTFLSNAYVPTDTLPNWLRFFADKINPLSRAVTAVRQILSTSTVGAEFWYALLAALIILIVFIPLTLRVYKRKG